MRIPFPALAILWSIFLFPAAAQQSGRQTPPPAESFRLEQLRAAMKIQFRDTAEFHAQETITLTATDPGGRVRKKASVHLDTVFQGYNPHAERMDVAEGTVTLGQALGVWIHHRWLLAMNGHFWITFPAAIVLVPERSAHYDFAAAPAADPGSLRVTMTQRRECAPVTMSYPKYFLIDHPCGASEFELTGPDHDLRRFTFEAAGLPATVNIEPWKACTLQRYHVEAEFHTVMLPHSSDPFVVPKRVTTTLDTDKGRVEIVSVYEPNEPALRLNYLAGAK